VGLCQAQGSGKKPAQSNHAEVRFGDGSIVRMLILQESLEVMTKYGKLIVPVRDIRRIDFGLHLPDGVAPQIETAIKQMGSSVYRQREGAVKDLVQLGHLAYPYVKKAAGSSDLEVSQRAVHVVKRISENTPPEDLRLKMEDTIHTVEFPITGRIISTNIKAYSAHFGDLSLKLSDLRSLSVRGASGELVVTVDASKYGSQSERWLDSGMTVDPNLRLIIKSEGQVDLWPQGPGQYLAAPKGYTTAGKGGAHMAGTLLGRVGDSGKVFAIGDSYEGIPEREGKLLLHIVASPWNNDSTGAYRVRIRTDYIALSGR
jgi:hypothetical protein